MKTLYLKRQNGIVSAYLEPECETLKRKWSKNITQPNRGRKMGVI